MTVAPDRATVRSTGRAARQALVGTERVAAERGLLGHLDSVHALHQGCVGLFVAGDGEPDLSPLVERLWAGDQVVAVPVLSDDPDDFSMRFVPWMQSDRLTPGRYGIPVPPARDPVVPETLLVSCVGFDRDRNRMGRGAGFFDRYLATATATVVGVAFERQRFERIPTEPHDVPMPVICTELGLRFAAAADAVAPTNCRESTTDGVRIDKDGSLCA